MTDWWEILDTSTDLHSPPMTATEVERRALDEMRRSPAYRKMLDEMLQRHQRRHLDWLLRCPSESVRDSAMHQ